MKNDHSPFAGMMRVMNHFFPHLADMFNQMDDPRHSAYIIYTQATLIMQVLMKCNSAIVSMRGMTKQFNTEEAILNLSYMSGQNLKEKPDRHLTADEQAKVEQVFGETLRKSAWDYDFCRKDAEMDPSIIRFVEPGTFKSYREKRFAEGVPENQFKAVRTIDSKEKLDCFRAAVMNADKL